MSDLFVDNIKHQSSQGSGTITIGASGETVALAAGATQSGFGLSGWSEDGANNNLLPASASAGIYLGVNSATAANLLDDYEEGTWTPTLTTGTSAQDLKYTKIGNVVHIAGSLAFTSVSGSGTIVIGGLPFTSTSHTESYTSLNSHAYKSLNIPGQEFQTLRVNIGSTNMNIVAPTSNGSNRTFGDHSHVTGSSFTFRVAGFYTTD